MDTEPYQNRTHEAAREHEDLTPRFSPTTTPMADISQQKFDAATQKELQEFLEKEQATVRAPQRSHNTLG